MHTWMIESTKKHIWQTFKNNQGNEIHLPIRILLKDIPTFPDSKKFDKFVSSFDVREIGPKPQNPKPGARRGKHNFIYFQNLEMLTFFKLAYGELIVCQQFRTGNGAITDA